MKRLSQLMGLPVVNRADGLTVGRLIGLLLNADGRTLEGLRVISDGFSQRRLVVPISQTLLMGDVSVIVKGRGEPEKKGGISLKAGRRVVSTAGARIGLLTNALLEKGELTALEVSKGAIDDWKTGRIWVNSFRVSSDEIVVSPGYGYGEEEGE